MGKLGKPLTEQTPCQDISETKIQTSENKRQKKKILKAGMNTILPVAVDNENNSNGTASETRQARRKYQVIFQVLKENNFPSKILYPLKISFRNKGQMKTF